MKKILVLLGTEPQNGGEHQYALTIMECLVKDCCKDVMLSAICRNRYWRKWCRENKIHVLNTGWYSFTMRERKFHLEHPLLSFLYSRYVSETGKILRKEGVDAIFVTYQGSFVPNLGIKTIIPVHDLMHRYEGRFPEVKSGHDEREFAFASNAKNAWCVLTDSKVGSRQFVESYSDYMKKKMPHIVSMPFVVPRHIAECREEFIETPAKYVFYPAQFWHHKNHLNLMKAIKILVKDIPDIHLILVGSEKNNIKTIKNYILENDLEKNVTVKGFVNDGNITYLYRHAVGLVMPSYFGPTNIPPLEAMTLGCPVAVSGKYGMPEQVGDAGLLFNPDSPEEIAECIRMMWRDETLRQNMIDKGYARVNKWTQKEFGGKLKKILNKI